VGEPHEISATVDVGDGIADNAPEVDQGNGIDDFVPGPGEIVSCSILAWMMVSTPTVTPSPVTTA
jgi:hypothetical protein